MSLSSRLERAQQLAQAQEADEADEADEVEAVEEVAPPAPVPQSADGAARRSGLLHEYRLRLQDEVMVAFDSLLDVVRSGGTPKEGHRDRRTGRRRPRFRSHRGRASEDGR